MSQEFSPRSKLPAEDGISSFAPEALPSDFAIQAGVRLKPHERPENLAREANSTFQRALELAEESDYRGAIRNAERALTVARDIYQHSAPTKLAKFCFALAGLSLVFGDSAKAESLIGEALPLRESLTRTEKQDAFKVLGLGIFDWDTRSNDPTHVGLGVKLLEVKLSLGLELYGVENKMVRGDLRALGLLHFNAGRYAASRDCFDRLLTTFNEDLSKSERVEIEYNYTACLEGLGETEIARERLEKLIEKAGQWRTSLSGQAHEVLAEARASLARFYLETRQLEAAGKLLEEATKELDEMYGAGSEKHIGVNGAMILYHLDSANFGAALDLVKEQLALINKTEHRDPIDVASTLMKYGDIMEVIATRFALRLQDERLEGPDLGNFDSISASIVDELKEELIEKLKFHREDFENIFENLRTAGSRSKGDFVEALNLVCKRFFEEAHTSYSRAEPVIRSNFGAGHQQLLPIYETLAGLCKVLGYAHEERLYRRSFHRLSADIAAANL